ncbi:DUF5103 domain-containing protein [Halosquirtibacter laminarini]|uniref:DUF5103 domain-containing protein n=1 Tax=Halosquirtibacter laminarini TaxID=3374600 RepID=A0AC61NFN9_9BACT|nr:DUF5103 domain-containing protein [Prolixibacteraceae bacterium]
MNPKVSKNTTFDNKIKSVQFTHKDNELSSPILLINSNQKLVLSFDDLHQESRNFAYTVIQCDWNWKPLDNYFNDYMEGMRTNEIYDYFNSENTQIPYTHCKLQIPNEDCKIIQTGNYLIRVYDADLSDEDVLMQRRFQVINPKVEFSGKVINSNLIRQGEKNQELFFDVKYPQLQVTDPKSEIHVVITQNRRWDIAREVQYSFQTESTLKFQNDPNLFFSPLNEFRSFTIRDEKSVNLHVETMQYIDPYYHATLDWDNMRRGRIFRSSSDINGAFTIVADRTNNPSTQGDYIIVHFRMNIPVDLKDGIYIVGDLTNWDTKQENRMYRIKGEPGYYADIILKEGIYNYQYGYKTNQDNHFNIKMFEGNFIETENEYQVWVYYSPIGARYSQLVGYTNFNSTK